MDGEGYPLKCKLAVGGGIFAFLAILFGACMVGSIHTIQEGSVGIYYVQGRDYATRQVIICVLTGYPNLPAISDRTGLNPDLYCFQVPNFLFLLNFKEPLKIDMLCLAYVFKNLSSPK